MTHTIHGRPIINCLRLGTDNPLHQDLLYELSRAIRDMIGATSVGEGVFRHQHVAQLLEVLDQSSLHSTSHFIELVDRFKGACVQGVEPVIVFDNVDHLAPAAIPEIGNLARAVHINTSLCVATAMRPSTYSTQSELSYGRGAFYSFLIEVNPPDIRAVIRRRLRHVFDSSRPVRARIEGGFNLEIADVERSLNSLCEKVLNPRTQEIFIRDICNNNVRLALSAFAYFLRYRDLKFRLLFAVDDGTPETLHGTWFDHLIDGLMIGDRDFFDDRESPISNILVFEDDSGCDYLILYMCLSVIGWAGRPFTDLLISQ